MADKNSPIYVTQPFMPPLEEFQKYLSEIWESKWLTNNGTFHQQLEKELCEYLGVHYISLFSNGTMALITALQTLGIKGEVITTPFSFVATTHALHWNGIRPVFVDIEPEHFNLDAEKIEAAITPETTAIMPVHVYGNPCDTGKISDVAKKYGLKVIYDACHAFGVKVNNNSVLNCGDLSVLSFHATKVFNTFEGGAIVCNDAETKKRIDFLKNFGFADEVTVVGPGINAKMNELQAAFGLLQLKYVDENIAKRKYTAELYRNLLKDVNGICFLEEIPGVIQSYNYFPVLIEPEYKLSRDDTYKMLKDNNIFSRRYFYPLISDFPTYKDLRTSSPDNLPVAQEISKKILCLPMYPALSKEETEAICYLLKN